jgi:hypothetical protein
MSGRTWCWQHYDVARPDGIREEASVWTRLASGLTKPTNVFRVSSRINRPGRNLTDSPLDALPQCHRTGELAENARVVGEIRAASEPAAEEPIITAVATRASNGV